MKEIISYSLPSILSMFAATSQFMLDVYFIGLLKNVAMTSGVGLGNMIVNLFGIQTFIGLNGAIETLVPQAMTGQNRNYEEIGTLLSRGRILICISFLPMLLMFMNSEGVLILLKQDKTVAKYA